MRIGIPKEVVADERRVAATPETAKKLIAMGHSVLVERGAGDGAFIRDEEYKAAGAEIASDSAELYKKAEIVLKVRAPEHKEIAHMKQGAIVVGLLSPANKPGIEEMNKKGLTCFALESLPRITRAQTMDVLSSQANVAGYKAVLMAADTYSRHFPMLMTAAGTIRPAKVLILGAGVAGLMAIATAKRLGAVVEAFDVRPAVKEQVQSLGAKFVEVPLSEGEQAETAGGYAREMSEDYKKRQAELIQKHAAGADIIITTAMIPGKPAPRLISEETVKVMKPGTVIVDLAVEAGGNCALSELGKTVVKHGVTFVGIANLPSLVAADSSALYARNVFNFLDLLLKNEEKKPNINREDEIIAGTLLCMGGEMLK
ncbi:MAG: Re/Si-specific NAD(P)(+) transhydrogenase subunit alpha [bacterium]